MTDQHGSAPRVAIMGGEDVRSITAVVRAMHEQVGFAVVIATPLERELVEALRPVSSLPIIDVDGEVRLEHGRIFIVPSRHDVTVRDQMIVVNRSVTSGGTLDRLLRSAAHDIGRNTVAVILPGPGSDGVIGLKTIKESGGVTIAHTPEGEEDGEMPRAAIATGFVDLVLSGSDIARRLFSLANDVYDSPALSEEMLRDILTMVRIRTGHDFSSYKRATLYRRIARRMQVCETPTLADYQRYLRDHPRELASLLRDFLISVTCFFRDTEAYDALAQHVIPRLFANRAAGEQIRVWVAGCASGEEAYSIGMLLAEHASRGADRPSIQVFATDIDEEALAEARAGRYPEAIAVDVSPERLARFFVHENRGYRVAKELREMMLFSPHNVLRDPPFSRLDLVSCRNLLIYMNRDAQDRALNTFHFALRPEGYLFLGSSETVETASIQYAPVDGAQRLFIRRQTTSSLNLDGMRLGPRIQLPLEPRVAAVPDRVATFGELHHRLVEAYAPPSVIVNDERDVVHMSEHGAAYLQFGGGEPTRQLFRIVLPALRPDLRTAIYAARETRETVIRTVRFDDDGQPRAIELTVHALDLAGAHGMYLLMFRELPAPDQLPEPAAPPSDAFIEPVVREIEDELHRTRDQLRTTIEQYETSLEEIKASNEELHAINEEVRSTSEEIETSKEELQSVNEELTTLNHELKVKVDELSRANNDLQNLMTSTDIGVLFLDRGLNLKRFTRRAHDLFNVIPSDIGRPLEHVTHRLEADDLVESARAVLQHLRLIEREITSRDGRRYFTRLLPYRSLEDRIDGVAITFVDVTDLHDAVEGRRRSEAALQISEQRLRLALLDAPMVLLNLTPALELEWGYVRGRELPPRAGTIDKLFAPGHAQRFATLAREVLASQISQRADLELVVDGVARTYELRLDVDAEGLSVVGFDVTPSKLAEASLREADRRKDEFLAILSHELRNPLTPLKVALDVAKLSTGNPEQLAGAHEIMERQVKQLSDLVDELLDLSRITHGRIELERMPVDPAVVIEAALEGAGPLLRQHNHSIDVQLPSDHTASLAIAAGSPRSSRTSCRTPRSTRRTAAGSRSCSSPMARAGSRPPASATTASASLRTSCHTSSRSSCSREMLPGVRTAASESDSTSCVDSSSFTAAPCLQVAVGRVKAASSSSRYPSQRDKKHVPRTGRR
ncbi:MAG: PAS domain-containing protein [Myxococcota bacterium]|nr:PAS domain-containing protein [Myxococcota bacterium]